jgi:hypothetical protein
MAAGYEGLPGLASYLEPLVRLSTVAVVFHLWRTCLSSENNVQESVGEELPKRIYRSLICPPHEKDLQSNHFPARWLHAAIWPTSQMRAALF